MLLSSDCCTEIHDIIFSKLVPPSSDQSEEHRKKTAHTEISHVKQPKLFQIWQKEIVSYSTPLHVMRSSAFKCVLNQSFFIIIY